MKKIDAVKTAISIHDGDYSSLRGKSFLICGNIKKKRRSKRVKKTPKYTLNQIGDMVVTIKYDVNALKQDVSALKQDVNTLKQDVNAINARLDYNNLKKLPK